MTPSLLAGQIRRQLSPNKTTKNLTGRHTDILTYIEFLALHSLIWNRKYGSHHGSLVLLSSRPLKITFIYSYFTKRNDVQTWVLLTAQHYSLCCFAGTILMCYSAWTFLTYSAAVAFSHCYSGVAFWNYYFAVAFLHYYFGVVFLHCYFGVAFLLCYSGDSNCSPSALLNAV